MTPDAIIARCVRHCAQVRDGRGRWRMERDTRDALMQAGSTPTIAAMTAKAAADVGAVIARRYGEAVRGLAA